MDVVFWEMRQNATPLQIPCQGIYVSPSIEYAAHPVYSTLSPSGENTWIQAVLQLRVKPGSFSSHPASLAGKRRHWDSDLAFDPNFRAWSGLEWLISPQAVQEGAIQVAGVMFRELGAQADPELHLACPLVLWLAFSTVGQIHK